MFVWRARQLERQAMICLRIGKVDEGEKEGHSTGEVQCN